jgi:cobalt/nickel transport protein
MITLVPRREDRIAPSVGTRTPVRRLLIPLAAALFTASAAPAHYNMLLPDKHSVKKDEAVTLTYQWGHPFEHQLFDAPAPEKLTVIAPDGKATDLTKSLEKTTVPAAEGKKVTAYQLKFTPDQRGDYVFVLETLPIWMEEEEEFFQDTVKTVLHVQAQKGWDASPEEARTALTPLTRPYGLQPGMVFQVVASSGVSARGADRMGDAPVLQAKKTLVEVERYNATPPKELPPDEHITRAVKTDPSGVATCTLTDAGWWAITAVHAPSRIENRKHDGKEYPVRRRATLWVFVDEKR